MNEYEQPRLEKRILKELLADTKLGGIKCHGLYAEYFNRGRRDVRRAISGRLAVVNKLIKLIPKV